MPGRLFASAMNSCGVFAATAGFTIIASGNSATSEIGANALSASYGSFAYSDGLIACVPMLPIRIV